MPKQTAEAGQWARLVADNLAASLRRRGYDAEPYGSAVGECGVQISAVHVNGWRYPDGHWEFRDHPVFAELDDGDEPRWSLLDHDQVVPIPAFGSVDAIAEWIVGELPAPEHLTCRLERHPDSIDSASAAVPADWYQAWQEARR